ncbi:MAG: NUDIX hydrolase [Eubacterium sp.]|nr:NUDIX hydrolase [Eubacterium sp.]
MIDIYNEKREKTSLQLPRKSKLEKGQFMLYVLALIQDKDGRFLITQRAMDKKWAAGQWEIPGGGAVAGESSFEAVCREVKEETGLDVSQCDPKVIYSYVNEDLERGDNYFVDIYLLKKDFTIEDVTIEKEEAIGVKVADFEEITRIHKESGFLHYKRLTQALHKGEETC